MRSRRWLGQAQTAALRYSARGSVPDTRRLQSVRCWLLVASSGVDAGRGIERLHNCPDHVQRTRTPRISAAGAPAKRQRRGRKYLTTNIQQCTGEPLLGHVAFVLVDTWHPGTATLLRAQSRGAPQRQGRLRCAGAPSRVPRAPLMRHGFGAVPSLIVWVAGEGTCGLEAIRAGGSNRPARSSSGLIVSLRPFAIGVPIVRDESWVFRTAWMTPPVPPPFPPPHRLPIAMLLYSRATTAAQLLARHHPNQRPGPMVTVIFVSTSR